MTIGGGRETLEVKLSVAGQSQSQSQS